MYTCVSQKWNFTKTTWHRIRTYVFGSKREYNNKRQKITSSFWFYFINKMESLALKESFCSLKIRRKTFPPKLLTTEFRKLSIKFNPEESLSLLRVSKTSKILTLWKLHFIFKNSQNVFVKSLSTLDVCLWMHLFWKEKQIGQVLIKLYNSFS